MQSLSGPSFFEALLEVSFGKSIKVIGIATQYGGCINNAQKLHTNEGDFFLKWQTGIPEDMFEKEAKGLALLAKTESIKVPQVLAHGKIDGRHYLLMEYLESGIPKENYWENFGETLAELHYKNSSETYGLDYDNYIGKLPQANEAHEDWITFFIQNRLESQLDLAIKNRMVSKDFIDRYRKLYTFLPDLLPVDKPALIHGDMWSGNVMVGHDGKVCLIDPAVYYGHREIELAFTRMFGGFDDRFYESYKVAYPLVPGFDERAEIYNIYPHMVHVNLFGQSYLSGVDHVLRRYV